MQSLTNLTEVRRLLSRHNFHLSKSLGQNFLINPDIPLRMAAACEGDPKPGILEIGPGIGVLTRALCSVAQKVVCVELDSRLPAILAETLADYDNVRVVSGDVLKLDLAALLEEEFPGMPVMVCANLPYYITSPILMRLLESGLPFSSIIVMVQREVAQRICRLPPHRDCSPLSYAIWYRARPKLLFSVSRGSFFPPPKVDSAVIELTLRCEPAVAAASESDYFALIRAAFSQRRKTIVNAVPAGYPITKAAFLQALDEAGLSSSLRAEQLSLEDFALLANLICRNTTT